MSNQESPLGRQPRGRRSFLHTLGAICIGVSGAAIAEEAELAYYAPHPSEQKNQVITVSASDGTFHSILRTQALLAQTQESRSRAQPVFPPAPVRISDDSIPSSSDIPGAPSQQVLPSPLSDHSTDDDSANASDLVPVPVEESFGGTAAAELPAPLVSRSLARPRLGAVAGSYSSAPNMIGDFFGGTFLVLDRTVALSGGDRRFKIAENTSPAPQDRVFFNYNHFENSLRDVNGVNRSLDRYTFGFEKTFLNSMASIEARLPFSSGLNSRQAVGVSDTESTELGNVALAFKATLLSGCDWVLSAGTTLSIPTGDDFELFSFGNTRGLRIENDAVHMAPFIGYLTQPNRCWFAQAFVQADFDLEGNDVLTSAGGFEGVLQDQNLLFIDASIGRWICRSCDPCDQFTGVAAIAELHYTTTLNDTDDVARITNPYNRMDILNATGALNFQFRKTSLRVGGAAPLREDEERLFDAEIIVQMNRTW